MSLIREAADALEVALKTVPGLRVYTDPGAAVTGTQGVIIAPPIVSWGAYRKEPTECTFIVHLVVPFDQYATSRLYDLVEPVQVAIELVPDFAVTDASPGMLPQGGSQLPTYALTVEVGL